MAFEAFKDLDGTYRWRMRDENGRVVKLPRPGRIMLPPMSAAERRRYRAAVQKVLADRVQAQEAAKA